MPLEFFIDEDIRRTPLTEEEKATKEEKALNRMLRHLRIENETEALLMARKNRKPIINEDTDYERGGSD